LGLVASLSRPGGNVTGVTNLNIETAPKQLELLRELVPTATLIGLLVNPTDPSIAEPFTRAIETAARGLGMEIHVVQARTENDFDAVFATLVQLRADGLVIMPDNYFYTRGEQLAELTFRHAIPTISRYRPFVASGGLASYASSDAESYSLMGNYAGKILKGAKPGDLPVQQATKVELIINLKTARILGLTISPSLLARADEVIE
jgi:putative ABC transport system substrate-binding protein